MRRCGPCSWTASTVSRDAPWLRLPACAALLTPLLPSGTVPHHRARRLLDRARGGRAQRGRAAVDEGARRRAVHPCVFSSPVLPRFSRRPLTSCLRTMRAARLWCAFTTPSMAIAYASSLNPKPQVRSPGWPSRGRPRPQRVHSGPALRSLTHAYYMRLLITRRGSCATPSTRVQRAKRRFSSRHSRCHSRSPRVGASVSVWRTGGLWRGASTDSGWTMRRQAASLMRPNPRHQSSLHRPRLHTVIHLINNTKTSQRPHSTRTHTPGLTRGLPQAR